MEYFKAKSFSCPSLFNPSDFFLDILSPDSRTKEQEESARSRINSLAESWTNNHNHNHNSINEEATPSTKPILQPTTDQKIFTENLSLTRVYKNFILLCWRSFTQQIRDIITLKIKFVMTIIFGLIIGGIYSNIGIVL